MRQECSYDQQSVCGIVFFSRIRVVSLSLIDLVHIIKIKFTCVIFFPYVLKISREAAHASYDASSNFVEDKSGRK